MAESTKNATTGSTRKPASARKKSTSRKSTSTRSRSTARRSTAAKSPTPSTARRARTTARNETREAAEAQVRAARTTAAEGRNLAERAALTYVGATLEARDRVLELVGRFGSRPAAGRELKRFERRGERDVKHARTQVERLVRRNQRAVEREIGAAERQADRRSNIVTERIATVSTRMEDAAQFGVATGSRLASVAKERVSALV